MDNLNHLKLGVDPKFLDTVFKEYEITKSSQAVPDVATHIEKMVNDANSQIPLTPDAYSRFRRALGSCCGCLKCATTKLYLSLIGSQQAAPMSGTETAIRSFLET